MKKPLLIALIGATVLPASIALAAPANKAGIVKLPTQQVEEKSLRNDALTRDVFRDFQGEYRLETGTMLRLNRHGGGIYAEVSGQPKVEVYATSANTLVAANGRTALQFEQDRTGTVTKVRLTQWGNATGV